MNEYDCNSVIKSYKELILTLLEEHIGHDEYVSIRDEYGEEYTDRLIQTMSDAVKGKKQFRLKEIE